MSACVMRLEPSTWTRGDRARMLPEGTVAEVNGTTVRPFGLKFSSWL